MPRATGQPEATGDRRPELTAERSRARLRRLIASIEGRPARALRAREPAAGGGAVPAAERRALAGMERRETEAGPLSYRERIVPLTTSAGGQPLGDIAELSPATLALLAPDEAIGNAGLADLYFLDIETTGLGGAGAIAFLVATARLATEGGVPAALLLRQYLAESPPEEAGVLAALTEDARLSDDPVLVTYNGRSFDAPLLDERATMHRRRAGFGGLRQLDLLPPARTAYRGLLPDCRLGTLEQLLLGMQRPSRDVPGADVPHWYFRFLRSGDYRMLVPIVEHNELDIVGMVGLLAWIARHLDRGAEATARDTLALGRLLAARGQGARARPHLERAAAVAPELGVSRAEGLPVVAAQSRADPRAAAVIREEALLRLAALCKRAGERERAAALWLEALALPAHAPLGPLLELAIDYEHRCHDFTRAIEYAERAGAHIRERIVPHDRARAVRLLRAIDHRLARLHARAQRARRAVRPRLAPR